MAWCDVVEPRTLRACRIALGQSQAAFAATLGASPESYRTWVLALSAVGAATLRRYGAIDYGPKWHLRPALWRKRLSSQGDTSHHQQRTAQAPTEHRTHAQPMAGELAEPGCSDAGQGWGSGQSFSL